MFRRRDKRRHNLQTGRKAKREPVVMRFADHMNLAAAMRKTRRLN